MREGEKEAARYIEIEGERGSNKERGRERERERERQRERETSRTT